MENFVKVAVEQSRSKVTEELDRLAPIFFDVAKKTPTDASMDLSGGNGELDIAPLFSRAGEIAEIVERIDQKLANAPNPLPDYRIIQVREALIAEYAETAHQKHSATVLLEKAERLIPSEINDYKKKYGQFILPDISGVTNNEYKKLQSEISARDSLGVLVKALEVHHFNKNEIDVILNEVMSSVDQGIAATSAISR